MLLTELDCLKFDYWSSEINIYEYISYSYEHKDSDLS